MSDLEFSIFLPVETHVDNFMQTHIISPTINKKSSQNLSSPPSGPFLQSEGPKMMPKSFKIVSKGAQGPPK